MLASLSQSRSLWIAFVSTIAITISFPIAGSVWGIAFIDALSDPAQVRQAISSMSAEQKIIHVWITATLDVAYPLAYGALFIGSAYRFYPKIGRLLALPIFVLVPTDLLEGIVQVLALTGTADFVDAKAVLTPLKAILFLFGLGFTILGWGIWLAARFRNN